MAVSATLNVRIDEALKERGNQVFARHGISTTTAVRKLYEYADREQEVPAWMVDQEGDECERKRRLLRELVGAIRLLPDREGACEDPRELYRKHLDEKYCFEGVRE
ncbi:MULTISPECIES: type II toxin-antitoxin system RelB/DinJ family antitoxin [unclassified Adlercreutzia]|uniref:type II toxin-antitoxin system RelB/DinJ family antitoxin n=1 Tax=unclassified Adlercreutzia TaxID=2636013 RepID=UPI0013E9E484|nr:MULTISPECIES: type II toxin-antitoxin system RelB/DinJ family antitoxin [unclassified Adlercreutzia]